MAQPLLDELLGDISDDLTSSTVAIVALSADDTFSSGNFHLDNDAGPDASLDLHKFAHEFSVGEVVSSSTLLLDVSAGYLSISQDVPISITEPDKIELDALSLGSGIGLKIDLSDRQQLIPRYKLLFARVSNDYDFASDQSQELLEPILNHQVVNFDVNTLTSAYSLEYLLTPIRVEESHSLTISSLLSFFYTDSTNAGGRIGSFNSKSTTWRNSVELDLESLTELQNSQISVRPMLARTDTYGDAVEGLGYNNFYDVGFSLVTTLPENNLIRDISLGCIYVYEKEIHGWRLGLSGSLS